MSSSSNSRCAACKQLRRRCPSDCIFLPYFPPMDPQRFSFVHRIFGASNVAKMLQKVEEYERGDVAESLYYEARCRIQDPVYGCVGIITILHEQIYDFQCQLAKVEAKIQAVKAQQLGHFQPQFPRNFY
nr:LOB domain-containing protein 24-like [Ipomoea batatas]